VSSDRNIKLITKRNKGIRKGIKKLLMNSFFRPNIERIYCIKKTMFHMKSRLKGLGTSLHRFCHPNSYDSVK
jgi:hypothetical protein